MASRTGHFTRRRCHCHSTRDEIAVDHGHGALRQVRAGAVLQSMPRTGHSFDMFACKRPQDHRKRYYLPHRYLTSKGTHVSPCNTPMEWRGRRSVCGAGGMSA